MVQIFRWMWVIIEQGEGNMDDGDLLGESAVYYRTRAECVAAARIWVQTVDYDVCTITRGPYLIVQSVDV